MLLNIFSWGWKLMWRRFKKHSNLAISLCLVNPNWGHNRAITIFLVISRGHSTVVFVEWSYKLPPIMTLTITFKMFIIFWIDNLFEHISFCSKPCQIPIFLKYRHANKKNNQIRVIYLASQLSNHVPMHELQILSSLSVDFYQVIHHVPRWCVTYVQFV